ncbi:hypothetical protein [Serratia symbiotica]|nr:hypothetical protein [Serratia symbiotica]
MTGIKSNQFVVAHDKKDLRATALLCGLILRVILVMTDMASPRGRG